MESRFETGDQVQARRKPRQGESLAQTVYDSLWRELVTWRLEPSDILVEQQVAKRFGTSRTPVREALKKLTQEGFLRAIPRAGYVVLPVTVNDAHEALHLRTILECEAASLAAAALTDEVAEGLRSWWAEFESTVAESSDEFDLFEVGILVLGLHVRIAHASGHRRLAAVIEALVRQTMREVLHPEALVDLDYVIRDHRVLLDAVLSGDPEQARSEMAEHLERHRERLLETLISAPSKRAIGIG